MIQQPENLSRRALLKALTVGCVTGAAITTTNTTQAMDNDKVATQDSPSGYHRTTHINNYYNSLCS